MSKMRMKPSNYAPAYVAMYPMLAERARQHGYALAVHGTVARDFDIVAVPWVLDASDPETLLAALVDQTCAKLVGGPPTTNPHGRKTWTLSIGFGECFVDLSVMPINPR